jgi:hypothetical protein
MPHLENFLRQGCVLSQHVDAILTGRLKGGSLRAWRKLSLRAHLMRYFGYAGLESWPCDFHQPDIPDLWVEELGVIHCALLGMAVIAKIACAWTSASHGFAVK